MSRVLASPITMWLAVAYLLAAFWVTLTWYVPQIHHLLPRMIEKWMYPINKTDLDVLRFAHFLALGALTVRFLRKDWPGLHSPWPTFARNLLPWNIFGVRGALLSRGGFRIGR